MQDPEFKFREGLDFHNVLYKAFIFRRVVGFIGLEN